MKKINMNFLKKLKEPKFKYVGLSTLVSVMVFVLLLGLYIGAKFLTEKFSLSFDLTDNKVFSLTDDSINYIKNIDKDIEITVLSDKEQFVQQNNYFKQADRVINEYARYNEKIKIKYLNLSENPNFKSNYPQEELNEYSIIVSSGEKYRVVLVEDIFDVQQTYTNVIITSSKAEQTMTSAIMYVVSDEQVKITMLTGFDELEYSGLEKLLNNNNYNVVKRSMLTENIDEDSSFAVIYSPKRDYDKESISKLKNYLYNDGKYGKNLLCFLNPLDVNMSNLHGFIEEWGMKAADGIVLETDISKLFSTENNYSQYFYVCEYVDESYSSFLKNTSIPVAMPLSKPIEIIDNDRVSTLLQFSDTSVVIPSDANENWKPSDAKVKGPIPAMVMSTLRNDETGEKSTFTLVGSSTAVDENLLSRTALNNSSYFLNLFNNVTERKDTINIESKSLGVRELGINPLHAIIIGACLTILLPVIILIIGLIVWIVKRKR